MSIIRKIIKKINEIKSSFYYLNFSKNKLPVFWHDCNGVNNFGDQLNPYLIGKLTKKEIVQIKQIPLYSNRKVLVAIGSVISRANKNCVVWGSGIIDSKANIKNPQFIAVRGPRTQKRITELGFYPPKTLGDPAILLPKIYYPKIKKKYKMGIVPHFEDYYDFKKLDLGEETLLIDLTLDIEKVVKDILMCEKIISSSLHGIIVANAYNIPSVWAIFSNKIYGDNVKYYDYFESVNLFNIKPLNILPSELKATIGENSINYFNIETAHLNKMQDELLRILNEYLEPLI